MPHIIPMEKLKNLEEVYTMCSQHEPVYITKDGFGKMAVLCMEDYDALKRKVDNYIELKKELAGSPIKFLS